MSGNAYTGYGADASTDAAIYNNSGGLVTIEIPLGGQVPTVRNGARASTSIVSPDTTFTFQLPNIIDNSRFQIYNVTQDVELTNTTTSGGTGIDVTYIKGTDYDAGDTGRYRITYQSGASARESIEGTFTFPTDTAISSSPTAQANQNIYNLYAVDGSGIAEFTWDSGNIQIDINDADNTTAVQRLAAWHYYFITTATGINEAFGGLTWENINSIKVNTATVDMKLDNTKASPLTLTGGRLYRDDGATIIASTSNSLQVDYDPVYVVETGGGGGGGHNIAAGGGAGGMRVLTGIPVTTGTFPVTIGGGGVGSSGAPTGSKGQDTTFALTPYGPIVGEGGGGGGSYPGISGVAGGSGGGGCGHKASPTPGVGGASNASPDGISPTTQGNAGGAGSPGSGPDAFSGGGGGAGGPGGNGIPNTAGGPGGVGLANDFRTGSNVYYAGGGGGAGHPGYPNGSGGNGGGGDAGPSLTINGTANTGGGGGGSQVSPYVGGTGGSGIVVIRYQV